MSKASLSSIAAQIERLADARQPKRKKRDRSDVLWKVLEELHEELGVYIPLPRSKDDISKAEAKIWDLVWYNRHQCYKQRMRDGLEKKCDPKVWEHAKKAAVRIEKKYKNEPLAWDDFEWGMLNGKFSALRWVMGNEWDWLDT